MRDDRAFAQQHLIIECPECKVALRAVVLDHDPQRPALNCPSCGETACMKQFVEGLPLAFVACAVADANAQPIVQSPRREVH